MSKYIPPYTVNCTILLWSNYELFLFKREDADFTPIRPYAHQLYGHPNAWWNLPLHLGCFAETRKSTTNKGNEKMCRKYACFMEKYDVSVTVTLVTC